MPHPRTLVGLVFGVVLTSWGGHSLANQAPVIDSLTPSATLVAPGGTVTFALEAHDPDCPDVCTSGCGQEVRSDLTGWSTTGGTIIGTDDGVTGSPYSATADWQAPATEGIYTISVYVADSGAFICGGRQSVTQAVNIQVATATDNLPPVIQSLTAESGRLFPAESTRIMCIASDPDGGGLTYSWLADFGTIAPDGQGIALFDAGPAPGIVTVTCTATDDGGLSASQSIPISVTDAMVEKAILQGLTSPQRLDVDSMGDLYVADPASGGIAVIHLYSGEPVYHIPIDGVTSLALDWGDRILVGGRIGARLCDRNGVTLLELESPGAKGTVSDVAVDDVAQRYGVLHQSSGRVTVYDAAGSLVAEFGSIGDGPDQLKSPMGLAAGPAGEWVVADSSHGLIKVFDGAGAYLRSFGGLGGGSGEFVQLADVAVNGAGVVFASDAFQSRVLAFNPDGTLREMLGTYGAEPGQLITPIGVALVEETDKLLVASSNGSSVQVFRTSNDPLGNPPTPLGQAEPATLAFAPQQVGTTGLPSAIVLSNAGQAPLGVRGIQTSSGFTQTNDCGLYLDPGAGCTLQVSFAPTTPGAVAGSVAIETSAPEAPLQIGLRGEGLVPAIVAFAPDAIQFGDQVIGSVSGPVPVSLTNVGGVPLEVASLVATASFLYYADCGPSLPPGGGCTIQVRFAPEAAAGTVQGSLILSSNAPGGPHQVALFGRALHDPDLSIAGWTGAEGDSGTTGAEFRVVPSFPPLDTVTVNYATVPGTATEGEDYEAVSGSLELYPGQTSATVVVPVLGDRVLEADEESFSVVLSGAVGAVVVGGSAAATIEDDEQCVSPDLLVNPGAEAASGAGEIPGWTVIGGAWRVSTAPPSPAEGDWYFASTGGDVAELQQVVDLSVYSREILLGRQWFTFEALVRSADEVPADAVRVVVEFLHRDDQTLLAVFDSGEIIDAAGWHQVTHAQLLPAQTGSVRVRLIATRHSATGADGLFDAVTLRSIRTPTLTLDDMAVHEGKPDDDTAVPFALNLSCGFGQILTVQYATRDGSAIAGEDYLGRAGAVVLPAGSLSAQIDVRILGDTTDEPHKQFFLDLSSVDPAVAVVFDPTAQGTILNDDFCARNAIWWRGLPGQWPVATLTLGGVVYDVYELIQLFDQQGDDAGTTLAVELATTLLNLEQGSAPGIQTVADAADLFLVQFPPGSQPTGAAGQQAEALREELREYNNATCTDANPGGGDLLHVDPDDVRQDLQSQDDADGP